MSKGTGKIGHGVRTQGKKRTGYTVEGSNGDTRGRDGLIYLEKSPQPGFCEEVTYFVNILFSYRTCVVRLRTQRCFKKKGSQYLPVKVKIK